MSTSSSLSRPPLPRCVAHGLHFDPGDSHGCVLCKRPKREPIAGKVAALGGGAVALSVAVVLIAQPRLTRSPEPTSSPQTQISTATETKDAEAPAEAAQTPEAALLALPGLRAQCASGSPEACARVDAQCTPMKWTAATARLVRTRALSANLAHACGGDQNHFHEQACVKGDWRSCAIADRTTRGSRLEEALDAACDDRDIAACRELARRMSLLDAAKARAVESYVRILDGCQQANRVFCDVPSGGWRSLVVPTSASSASRSRPQSSSVALPEPWREVPPLRSPQQIAQILTDAGVPRNDAGVFLLSGGPVQLGFDPNSRSPEQGFAHCIDRVTSCMMLNRQIDKCVDTVPRCRSTTPWLGDPAGDDCCPQRCVDAYVIARASGKGEGIALEEMSRSRCYPGP